MGDFFLALDASGETASAAIICNGTAVATKTQNASEVDYFRSTELLLPLVNTLRNETSLHLGFNECDFSQKLQGILVGTGPGSFTGVRSAISTAIGLSIGWRTEIAGMSILHAMAYSHVQHFVDTIGNHISCNHINKATENKPRDMALSDPIFQLLRDGKCDKRVIIAPLKNANANEFFTELYELQPRSKNEDGSHPLHFDLVSISPCFTVGKSNIEGDIVIALDTTSKIEEYTGEHISVASSPPLIFQVHHPETNLASLIGTTYAHIKMSQNKDKFTFSQNFPISGNAPPHSYAIDPVYGKKVCALTIAERRKIRNN